MTNDKVIFQTEPVRLPTIEGVTTVVHVPKGARVEVVYRTEDGERIYLPPGMPPPTTLEGWKDLIRRQREQQRHDYLGYFREEMPEGEGSE